MSKYNALKEYLAEQNNELIELSFHEVEVILSQALPKVAKIRAEWWANEDVSNTQHVQCKSWQEAGYDAKPKLKLETILFSKKKAKDDLLNCENYKRALNTLIDNNKLSQNIIVMIKENYYASGYTTSAENLAKAAGYDTFGTANMIYGTFAKKVAEIIGYKPRQRSDGSNIWTFTICTAAQDSNEKGHFQWTMRSEFVEAIEQLNIVKTKDKSNIFSELETRQDELTRLDKNHRKTIINARIGQGQFREKLIGVWQGCSISNCDAIELLIASHIKPWKDCTIEECIDEANGLLLLPNIDKVFDKGWITFDENGKIEISNLLSELQLNALRINPSMRLRFINEKTKYFLEYHRKNVFQTTN